MAVDKLVDSTKLDACLDAEADAIRAKTGGSSDIPFDFANNKGFADAIAAIPSGGSTSFDWASTVEIVTVGANSVSNISQEIQYFSNYAPDLIILLSPMTRANQMIWTPTVTNTYFGRANSSLSAVELKQINSSYDAYLIEGTQYLVLKA